MVIQDSFNYHSLGSGDDSLGTTGSRNQVVDFATGPEKRLITVKVMRVPGNPLIKGTFWLDDVQLAAISTAESNHGLK